MFALSSELGRLGHNATTSAMFCHTSSLMTESTRPIHLKPVVPLSPTPMGHEVHGATSISLLIAVVWPNVGVLFQAINFDFHIYTGLG